MNIEDIKVGETYNIRMKVTNKEKDMVEVKNPMVSVYGCDYMIISHKYIHAIHEQPKYAPCRKFKKGDIVRLKAYNGRKPYDFWHKQTIEHFGAKLDTVLEDELESGNVDIFQDAPIDELTVRVHASHLELVTPVEELERYYIELDSTGFAIIDRQNVGYVAHFKAVQHPNAKAAAEAERDRLNAEYRKEQRNDK